MNKRYLVVIIVLLFSLFVSNSDTGLCLNVMNIRDISNPINSNAISFDNNFDKTGIMYIENFLKRDHHEQLRHEIKHLQKKKKHTNTLVFRKASVIGLNDINKSSYLLSLYLSKFMVNVFTKITKKKLQPILCNDNANLNVLIYDSPNDHISWHYDNNNYSGKKYTVLMCVDNKGPNQDGLSSYELKYKAKGSFEIKSIKMKPNSIVIFDIDTTLHKATPIKEGEYRALLSMCYTNNLNKTLYGKIYEYIQGKIFGY